MKDAPLRNCIGFVDMGQFDIFAGLGATNGSVTRDTKGSTSSSSNQMSKCYHTIENVEKGNRCVNYYPFTIPKPEIRTHEILYSGLRATYMSLWCQGAISCDIIDKVKYINTGFVIEYMHCVLLGVPRQFVTESFDSSCHNELLDHDHGSHASKREREHTEKKLTIYFSRAMKGQPM